MSGALHEVGGRWLWLGEDLNEWPGINGPLELRAITCRVKGPLKLAIEAATVRDRGCNRMQWRL